jgi:tRNA (cmo5U34)-methyltransferase
LNRDIRIDAGKRNGQHGWTQDASANQERVPMNQNEIKAIFDQQAAGYDAQWKKTAPISQCLHFLLGSMFAGLPADARILCVGVGTGAELAALALTHPGWRFTAVEPSGPMLEVCRQRATQEGFASRCTFHEGYLDSLPEADLHDAATCFLVSQFILDASERTAFFRGIANRLKPGGLLASSDLASDTASPEYDVLLQAWMSMMSAADISAEGMARMRRAYTQDVGVLPPDRIAAIIAAGGFELPVRFFQAGLIHAWLSKRADDAT